MFKKNKISVKPILYKDFYNDDGSLKKRYQYVDKTKMKSDKVFVPIWCCSFMSSISLGIFVILAGALFVLFAPRPGFYTESCVRRSCVKGLNLKCVDGICNCSVGEYYDKGCKTRKLYNTKCNANLNNCFQDTNMSCFNSSCTCNSGYFWNGVTCLPQKTYNQRCTQAGECRQSLILDCDKTRKQCICPSDRYWDSTVCYPKKGYASSCNKTEECIDAKNLICLNSSCTCNSTSYWDEMLCAPKMINQNNCTSSIECAKYNGTACINGVCSCVKKFNNEMYWDGAKCANASSYGLPCQNASTDYMCMNFTQETKCLLVGSSYICDCLSTRFFNSTANKCENRLSYNATCSNNDVCLNALGLSCTSAACRCSDANYWNGSICVEKKIYTRSCRNSNECSDSLSLECQTIDNQCNCPAISSIGMCDCPRTANNEMYWDGAKCANASSYGSPCQNASTSYMCQKSTQETVCILIGPAYRCDCASTFSKQMYWNGVKCTNSSTYGESCQNASTSYMCMTLSQGTSCTLNGSVYTCGCSNTEFFNATVEKCVTRLSINASCNDNIMCSSEVGLNCSTGLCLCSSSSYWNGTYCAAKKTFSENCTSSNECTNYNGLICQTTANQCNCPIISSIGMCDCPRSLDSEMYWDGAKCINVTSYGSPCQNSSTSYMCPTLTQDTVCTFSGLSYRCGCASTKYYHMITLTCVYKLSLNESCSSDAMCDDASGLTCQSLICDCSSLAYWNGSICVPKKSYTEVCVNDNECNSTKALICQTTNGACNCPVSSVISICDCGPLTYWSYTDAACVPVRSYTDPCANTYECDTSVGLLCSADNNCSCPLGGFWFWSYYSNKCVQCPSDWTVNSGHCYYVNNISLTWDNAENWCKSKGANLIKIDDSAEYDLLYNFYVTHANGSRLFVGAKARVAFDFYWSADNSSFSRNSSFWCTGEPNNSNINNATIYEGCTFILTLAEYVSMIKNAPHHIVQSVKRSNRVNMKT